MKYDSKEFKNLRFVRIYNGHVLDGDEVLLDTFETSDPCSVTDNVYTNGSYHNQTVSLGQQKSITALIATPVEIFENQKIADLQKSNTTLSKQITDLKTSLRTANEDLNEAQKRCDRLRDTELRLSKKNEEFLLINGIVKKYEQDMALLTKHFGTAAINAALSVEEKK